jgi:hypothetical protein
MVLILFFNKTWDERKQKKFLCIFTFRISLTIKLFRSSYFDYLYRCALREERLMSTAASYTYYVQFNFRISGTIDK